MENAKIKVKIKTWDKMVKKYGWYNIGSSTNKINYPNIKLKKFGWNKELEELMPEDRIVEVESRYRIGEYYMVDSPYGISQDAIAEYLTDESGNDLTKLLKLRIRGLCKIFSKFWGDLSSTMYKNN